MRFTLAKAVAALAVPLGVFLLVGSIMSSQSGRREALAHSVPPNPTPLNMRFGYDVGDVDAFWAALGVSGRTAEQRFLEYDLIFPTFYGGALAASLLWLLSMFDRPWHPLLVASPVVVTVLADWTENLVQLEQLHRYSALQLSGLQGGAIHLASYATSIKLVGVAVTSLTLITLIGMLARAQPDGDAPHGR